MAPIGSRHLVRVCVMAVVSSATAAALITALRAQPRPAATANAKPIYAIRIPQVNSTQTGVLVMNAQPMLIVEQRPSDCNGERGINSDHAPLEQLPTRDCLFGGQCLKFEGFAAPNRSCGPDRIEVDVGSSEDASGLRYGETAYLQFFIRVDPHFEKNFEGALISQVWQATSVAYGGRPALGPVFSISLVSNVGSSDVVDLEFRARTEVSAQNPFRVFTRCAISKGEWHAIQLELTPRYIGNPDGPGQIFIWLDRDTAPNLAIERAINYDADDSSRYRFYWGYAPDPTTRLGSSFDVRLGIYRAGPYTSLKFGLDGVRLTRHKADLGHP